VRDVQKLSVYMASRAEVLDRDIQNLSKQLNPTKRAFSIPFLGKKITAEDAQNMAFAPLRTVDAVVTTITWMAAHDKFLAANTHMAPADAQAQAIKEADEIVARSQPSSRPHELSKWQRGQGVERVLTMLMTWNLKSTSEARLVQNGWLEGKVSSAEFAKFIAMYRMAPVLGSVLVGHALSALFADDDDRKRMAGQSLGWELLAAGAAQHTASIPIIGSMPMALSGGLEGSFQRAKFYAQNLPVIKPFTLHLGSMDKLGDAFYMEKGGESISGDEALILGAEGVAQSLFYETGIPVDNLARDLYNAKNNIFGE
jgi:hypothetical protein